jgi:hypothetical protein
MSRDFERWDNSPALHSAPPDVERVMRAEDRRRRRKHLLIVALIMIATAAACWAGIKF